MKHWDTSDYKKTWFRSVPNLRNGL